MFRKSLDIVSNAADKGTKIKAHDQNKIAHLLVF